MSTITEPQVRHGRPIASDKLDHVYCECDPDLSLCGLDISDLEIVDEDFEHIECNVCDELLDTPCVRCGAL